MEKINNDKNLIDKRKGLRNNATPQELLLWRELKNSTIGFKFRRQHSIGKYIVDFYCPAKKLIIEIDGSQHFEKDAVLYDAVRTRFFESMQLHMLRFTNAEINTNMEGVLLKIKKELDHPLPPPRIRRGEVASPV